MFEIEYKGANAVILATKKTKVIFDPNLSVVGIKDVDVKNAVEVTTEDRFAVHGVQHKLLVSGPGEYEIGDIALLGLPARRHIDAEDQGMKATVYRVVIGDVRLAVIGNVAPKLTEDQLEALGVVDIIIIPVGGNGYTLDATDAAFIVRQIGPRAVIPVHYADSNLKYEVPQDDVETFIKELAANVVEAGPKLKIKSISTLPEQLSVMQITRS